MTESLLLGSSLRAVAPELTLVRARRKAAALGITRVTEITRLDRVGIPTFASIRPSAIRGSLCVNAGKGLLPIEAEVGATMEAVEFALAEPGASPVRVVSATARDVLDGRTRPDAITDLCPRLCARIALDAPMDCVMAESIDGSDPALVPAELVFLPFRPRARFRGHFGASSNGLASGNTVREATVHGLCELIERDIRSFQTVRSTSAPVDLDSVAGPAARLVAAIREADLDLYVRTAPNVFGLPYFAATLHDRDAATPHLLNGGYGCHPHRSIAFVRAVTEAAQSRLSFIHGGRDDLVDHAARFRGWSARRKRAHVRRVVDAAGAGRPVRFERVPDHPEVTTVERCEEVVLSALAAAGMTRAYRVRFSRPDDDLQVVRVIVPKLELFGDSVFRVGARLRAHARPA